MTLHLKQYRDGFPVGITWITRPVEEDHPTGIGLGVLKMKAGEKVELSYPEETAYLLMEGRVEISFHGETHLAERASLFIWFERVFSIALEGLTFSLSFSISSVKSAISCPPAIS